MSKPLRLAVIGTGHLGRIHARLAHANSAFELVAIVDPIVSARDAVASELGVESHHDHHELVGRIDAAIVAAPTCFHHDLGIDLLQQGVDLLIEKPLARSLDEAEQLVQCAARNKRILQVGHIERFNPALVAARPHIRVPKFIEANRLSGYSFRSTDIGVVLDIMIHDVDVILDLVDARVARVEALGASVMGQHEDIANARLTFENGCVASLSASRVSPTMARTMQVWSADGFTGIDFAEGTARLIRPDHSKLADVGDPTAMTTEEKSHARDRLFEDFFDTQEIVTEPRNALADEQADFASAITNGHAPRVSAEAGRDALSVCQRILDSIQSHAWEGDGHASQPERATLRGPHWSTTGGAIRRQAG